MRTAHKLTRKPPKPPRTLRKLREYLQAAVEIEHLTIPVYMTGLYSIRPGTNLYARSTIRSVLLEEMLHMTLASNLLNAVGGRPDVAHPDFVAGYPAKLPMSDPSLPGIPLQHFSQQALETFMLIERPRALVPTAGHRGWTSIGQFYDLIRQGLVALVQKHGEPAVFSGDLGRQVGPEDFYNSGGEAFRIVDLKSALLAVQVISEQGEGVGDTIWDSDDTLFGEERQVAHYFRFKEILAGRRYGVHDLPRTGPSGALIDVSWDDAYPVDRAAKVAKYPEGSQVRTQAERFNLYYAQLLCVLHQAVNGEPGLMARAIPQMLRLRDLAERLYRNPHPDPQLAKEGLHASPTFELTEQHFTTARASVQPVPAREEQPA